MSKAPHALSGTLTLAVILVGTAAPATAATPSLPIEAMVYYVQTATGTPTLCNGAVAYDTAGSGSTQLISLASGAGIFICGYTLFAPHVAQAQLVYGTGTNCETGRVALTPPFRIPANKAIVDGGDNVMNGLTVPASNALCIVTNYTYYRTITIDHTKVGTTNNTDQSNFPVLISGTYSYLATVANGGTLQNSNGYDIMFTSDAAGTTPLSYEVESYNASTGAVNIWVQVPTVSHSSNTVIYMWYGNATISTAQANATGTWDQYYQGVWHMADNAATPTIVDSTTQNNGTIVAGSLMPQYTNSYSTSGKIGNGLTFVNGSGNYGSSATMNSSFGYTNNFTIEGWFYFNGTPYGIYTNLNSGVGNGYVLNFAAQGLNIYNGNRVYANNSSTGAWEHIVVNCISNTLAIYLNGAQAVSASGCAGAGSGVFTINSFYTNFVNAGYNSQMVMDELRISNTGRTADWIVTSYNSQNSPSTFYTVGSQQQP